MRGRVNAIRTFKGLVADLRISKELWNELLEERQDDHTFDIYRHDIESLGDDTKTLDEVIEIVIELIKKVK